MANFPTLPDLLLCYHLIADGFAAQMCKSKLRATDQQSVQPPVLLQEPLRTSKAGLHKRHLRLGG